MERIVEAKPAPWPRLWNCFGGRVHRFFWRPDEALPDWAVCCCGAIKADGSPAERALEAEKKS